MVKSRAFIGGMLFGGLAGVILGVLTAPKSGANLRNSLVDASDNIYRKAIYEFEELADKMEELKPLPYDSSSASRHSTIT